MANTMIKHGSNAGYKAELRANTRPCERCNKAHNIYQTQYTKTGKAKGLKYTGSQVLVGAVQSSPVRDQSRPVDTARTDVGQPSADNAPTDNGGTTKPSLGALLGQRFARLVVPDGAPNASGNDYVDSDETPDYLHSIEPDPSPAGDQEWTDADPTDFVINAAAMRTIEDNLGTYLSIVGMTAEMLDPYCGPVLAENFENIVSHWTKVIAHYPKAASLFMDGKGGVIFAWIGALQATWPLLFAFYEHHLSRNVRVENGVVQRKTEGNQGRFDPLQPPTQDSFNYSVG